MWRDTADLWPGEDWRAKIRQAIICNALVFIACFSQGERQAATGVSRTMSWLWRSSNCGFAGQTTRGSSRSGSMNATFLIMTSAAGARSHRSSASTCSVIVPAERSSG